MFHSHPLNLITHKKIIGQDDRILFLKCPCRRIGTIDVDKKTLPPPVVLRLVTRLVTESRDRRVVQ